MRVWSLGFTSISVLVVIVLSIWSLGLVLLSLKTVKKYNFERYSKIFFSQRNKSLTSLIFINFLHTIRLKLFYSIFFKYYIH